MSSSSARSSNGQPPRGSFSDDVLPMDASRGHVDSVLQGGAGAAERPLTGMLCRDMDAVLADMFVSTPLSTLKRWRVEYLKSTDRTGKTVLDMLEACKAANLPRKARKRGRDGSVALHARVKKSSLNTAAYSAAMRDAEEKRAFLANLETLEPVDDEASDGTAKCAACLDRFRLEDCIHCVAAENPHTVCRRCFYNYALKTVQVATADTIRCMECTVPYLADAVRFHIPTVDLREMERRQEAQNYKVALAAGNVKAKLFCQCGAVGVVEAIHIGNGIVECPSNGCGRRYCVACGNYEHAGSACPAPKETLQWVAKHAKQCPNCGEAIQKNNGCNHMTCSRKAGGCGYEFCWKCLKKYRTCKCSLWT